MKAHLVRIGGGGKKARRCRGEEAQVAGRTRFFRRVDAVEESECL